MKKNNIILLVLLAISAAVAFYLINNDGKAGSTGIDLSDRSFAVEDPEDVDRIVISLRNGSVKDFKRKGNNWILNGGVPVGKSKMHVLMQTITRVQVDHIPHPNARKNILDEIGRIGIQVEVYTSDSDTPEKTYYVGGSTIDEYGTYYLMKGKKQPYVILVKGINGSIRSRFTYKDHEWADPILFHDKKEEIKEISVEYPQEKSSSFKLYDLDKDSPKIKPLFRLTEDPKPILKPRLEAYMQDFVDSACEYTYDNDAKRDSIATLVPFADVKFTNTNDEKKWIKLYALNEINNTKYSKQTIANQNRIERYYAITDDERFLLVQRVLVGEWLRPYDYFVK